jgi:5-formyltetrahydrofolate cyclo-ligase
VKDAGRSRNQREFGTKNKAAGPACQAETYKLSWVFGHLLADCMTAPDHPKIVLRREMRRRMRDSVGDGQAVCTALGGWLDGHPQCRTIAAFAALPGEPDLMPVVLDHPERCWAFPRVDEEALVFHRVEDPASNLVPGAFGIAEPLASLPVLAVNEIDVFLCPGLAFDRDGGRLGRGRGFYDRLLAGASPTAVKLGVAFLHQIIDCVPCDPHDVRMDGLIRPR